MKSFHYKFKLIKFVFDWGIELTDIIKFTYEGLIWLDNRFSCLFFGDLITTNSWLSHILHSNALIKLVTQFSCSLNCTNCSFYSIEFEINFIAFYATKLQLRYEHFQNSPKGKSRYAFHISGKLHKLKFKFEIYSKMKNENVLHYTYIYESFILWNTHTQHGKSHFWNLKLNAFHSNKFPVANKITVWQLNGQFSWK